MQGPSICVTILERLSCTAFYPTVLGSCRILRYAGLESTCAKFADARNRDQIVDYRTAHAFHHFTVYASDLKQALVAKRALHRISKEKHITNLVRFDVFKSKLKPNRCMASVPATTQPGNIQELPVAPLWNPKSGPIFVNRYAHIHIHLHIHVHLNSPMHTAMHVYVCMSLKVYIYIYMYMSRWIHSWIRMHNHTCTYTYRYTYLHIYIYTYTYAYARRICIYIYIYTYIHTYIHTYTHMYI